MNEARELVSGAENERDGSNQQAWGPALGEALVRLRKEEEDRRSRYSFDGLLLFPSKG